MVVLCTRVCAVVKGALLVFGNTILTTCVYITVDVKGRAIVPSAQGSIDSLSFYILRPATGNDLKIPKSLGCCLFHANVLYCWPAILPFRNCIHILLICNTKYVLKQQKVVIIMEDWKQIISKQVTIKSILQYSIKISWECF